MALGPNPYTPSCFAPRDRLTWLYIMSETTGMAEDELQQQEQLCINRDRGDTEGSCHMLYKQQ